VDASTIARALGAAGLAVQATLSPGVEATLAAYDDLAHVLAAEKLQLDDVVKTTIYAVDPYDLPAIEAATRAVFPRNAPAVTVVGVHSLPVPGARVEIEAVAAGRQR
jgi:enamine deaminase RidA (YjgF/YER057c/UK114 family)